MRGSREISLVPSLHRASTDALIYRRSDTYIHKWKNHFYEMKGDVGMSLHKKERNKKIPTQDTKSLITPSLHLCFALTLFALGKANSTTS